MESKSFRIYNPAKGDMREIRNVLRFATRLSTLGDPDLTGNFTTLIFRTRITTKLRGVKDCTLRLDLVT